MTAVDDEKDEIDLSRDAEEENKNGISSDLIRGHINTIILRTLYERDKYGYEIIEEIESKSKGQYTLKQPTLYSALKRLESQGYINAYWKTDEVSQGGRRKYYTLTDSGRAVTEKNQAEWEYSRTVIDNLISDKNFDFSQPAPAAVDFKILKNSTTRVPVLKDEVPSQPVREGEILNNGEQTSPVTAAQAPETPPQQPAAPAQSLEQPVRQSEEITRRQPETEERPQPMPRHELSEEKRRILHENYLNLISTPVKGTEDTAPAPFSENLDTEKLIYNNKPETERDYKNLINNIYERTVTKYPKQVQPEPVRRYGDASELANRDGLTVNTSEYTGLEGQKHTSFNRYDALFKSALIVAVVMALEFALCLIFKNELKISIAYPFVILALGAAQLLIFGILKFTDTGKNTRKPIGHTYLTASVVLSVIFILIIFLIALLLNINFSSVGDIFAKFVIPSIVALNIPLFAFIFYMLCKQR